jgi:hypothetical protein
LTSVAPGDIGKASGTFSTLRQLGGAFGVAVLVAVFTAAGSYVSAEAFSDGFAAAMAACAGLSVVGALAGIALPRRNVSDLAPPETQAVPAFESDGS